MNGFFCQHCFNKALAAVPWPGNRPTRFRLRSTGEPMRWQAGLADEHGVFVNVVGPTPEAAMAKAVSEWLIVVDHPDAAQLLAAEAFARLRFTN